MRQSLREGGIPFEVRLEQPNKETVAAMLEAERIAKDPSVKGYNDLDELFADLHAINSWRSLVCLNSLIRFVKVVFIQDRF